MAAFQKPSQAAPQAFADAGKKGINKYDFGNYNIYKDKLKNIYKTSENVVEKYNTKEEKYQIKVLKVKKTITMYDVLEDNDSILINSNLSGAVILGASGAGADDRKKRLSQLQKEILKDLKPPATYNPYIAEQKLARHFQLLHRNIEIYKENYIKLQKIKDKNK
jgi:hypothetical protein